MTAVDRFRSLVPLLLACVAATSLGCAFGEIRWDDPLRREITFEEAQQRYTVLVRWSKWEEAIGFVHPEVREQFTETAPDHRNLRFTDYETDKLDFSDDKKTATVEVTYLAYLPAAMIEVEIHETQKWERDGRGNKWVVRPQFTDLDRFAYALGN